jgi:hypothetical protein
MIAQSGDSKQSDDGSPHTSHSAVTDSAYLARRAPFDVLKNGA